MARIPKLKKGFFFICAAVFTLFSVTNYIIPRSKDKLDSTISRSIFPANPQYEKVTRLEEESASKNEIETSSESYLPEIETDPGVLDDRVSMKLNKAFYLTLKSSTKTLDRLKFRLKKLDGTYTGMINVSPPDGDFGEKAFINDYQVSKIYYFPGDYQEVEWVNPEKLNFKVKDVDLNNSESISAAANEVYEFEKEYKKRLFGALGINIITREEWGAPSYSDWTPSVVKVNRIVVHHTATSVNMSNPSQTVKAIYDEHRFRCSNNVGRYPDNCALDYTWSDIGYNYLIDPHGSVYEGRAGGNGVIGAHAIPNSGSIGIGMLGNFDNALPTTQALDTLKKMIGTLSLINQFEVSWHTGLFGHRDYLNTACPGQRLFELLPYIANEVMLNRISLAAALNAKLKANDLVDNKEYVVEQDLAQIVINKSTLDPQMLQKMETVSRGISEVIVQDDIILYKIDQDLLKPLISETVLALPSTAITPNYLYSDSNVDQFPVDLTE